MQTFKPVNDGATIAGKDYVCRLAKSSTLTVNFSFKTINILEDSTLKHA